MVLTLTVYESDDPIVHQEMMVGGRHINHASLDALSVVRVYRPQRSCTTHYFGKKASNIAGNMDDYEKCGGQITGQISKHRSEWGKCAS